MSRNECNPGPGEGIQIQVGELTGIGRSKTEGSAYRKLLRLAKVKSPIGAIVRYRVVKIKGSRPISPWFYVESDSINRTR